MADLYWKTARELAECGLEGLPESYTGMIDFIKRNNWRDFGSDYARERKGNGGGWEYHINCLPDAARADYERRFLKNAHPAPAVVDEIEPKSLDQIGRLKARQRKVMDSRALVLREIERRQVVNSQTRRQAILGFIDAYNKNVKLPQDLRDLSDTLVKAGQNANDRGVTLSRSQIYDWFKAREDGGIAALAPTLTRKKEPVDGIEFLPDLLRFYCRPSKPSLAQALREMSKAGLESPHYDAARRAIAKLKGSTRVLDAHRGREGSLALKARMAFVRRSTEGMEPCDVYTSDGKTFDAEVAHPETGKPFKPEITWIIDVVTRKAVGWSAGLAENSQGVADALRFAVENHGIPAIFYVDRGSGYKNKRLGEEAIGLCARLGTTVDHSLPQNSQARGLMERAHRTVINDLSKTYVSYLGKEMDRQAAQKFHKESRRELVLFGESKLLPSWSQFLIDLEEAIDEYNDRPHSALKIKDSVTGKMRKASPNEYWAQFIDQGFEPFIVDASESDGLFRPFVKRRCRRCELQYNNNIYFSNELNRFHDKDVFLAYDMHDAQQVWVYEIELSDEGKEVPGAFVSHAQFAGNEQKYFAQSKIEADREKRTKERLARSEKKTQDIREEFNPMEALEHKPAPSVVIDLPVNSSIEMKNPEPVLADADDQSSAPEIDFGDDAQFANWAIQNRQQLKDTQLRALRDLYNDRVSRELLKIKGVDLDAIRKIFEDAA